MIGHMLCRNCHLERFIEEKTQGGKEVAGRRRRKRKQPLKDPFILHYFNQKHNMYIKFNKNFEIY